MIVVTAACEKVSSTEVARVCQEFSLSPYRSLRSLTCEEVFGKLVIRGTVATYYLKQLAQTIALKSTSGLAVSNQISVSSW